MYKLQPHYKVLDLLYQRLFNLLSLASIVQALIVLLYFLQLFIVSSNLLNFPPSRDLPLSADDHYKAKSSPYNKCHHDAITHTQGSVL
jgi:hypothetical protein